MAKVIINIDWVPSNFGAAPANEGGACVATGKTLDEVEKNIIEAITEEKCSTTQNPEELQSQTKIPENL